MKICRMLLTLMLVTLATAPAFAQGAGDADALAKNDDPRLDQKVTEDAEGMRVDELLLRLSAETGVGFTAGSDRDDWMVQDRKIIVHVKEYALRDLMHDRQHAALRLEPPAGSRQVDLLSISEYT